MTSVLRRIGVFLAHALSPIVLAIQPPRICADIDQEQFGPQIERARVHLSLELGLSDTGLRFMGGTQCDLERHFSFDYIDDNGAIELWLVREDAQGVLTVSGAE